MKDGSESMAGGRTRAPGVYAIIGPDSYLAEESLEKLLSERVGADRADGLQILRGEETFWAAVLDAARTRSLFALRRAVVVRNAEALKGDDEEVAVYLGDPTPGVALVLMSGKPDKRRAAWKRILESATLLPADPLKGRALRAYVAEALRGRGLRLSEEGFEELLERVGQDLRRLMGEIEKLEAFAQGGQPLSAEDVASVLGKGIARPLYRLGDALMERRAGEVLSLMEEMVEEGEPPLKILSTLHWALRRVRGARALREARASREEVASRLGVMSFKVGDVLEASRRWSERELAGAIVALACADRRLKTGADPRWALAAAVTEACGMKSVRLRSPSD